MEVNALESLASALTFGKKGSAPLTRERLVAALGAAPAIPEKIVVNRGQVSELMGLPSLRSPGALGGERLRKPFSSHQARRKVHFLARSTSIATMI